MSRDVVKEWLNVTGQHSVLDPEEVIKLTSIIQNDAMESKTKKKALEKMVKCNTKMVVHITMGFFRRRQGLRLNDDRLNDYLQQGMLGLIRAVEKFDPNKGYKFSTYAYRWINSYLGRYHYGNQTLVHIPEPIMCSLFSGNNVNKQKDRIQDAVRFLNMDSLDRIVTKSSGERVRLGDALAL
ncbi:MAG: sigma-70 family RNA polymerase sigma factor [Polynucleobacter sp.]